MRIAGNAIDKLPIKNACHMSSIELLFPFDS